MLNINPKKNYFIYVKLTLLLLFLSFYSHSQSLKSLDDLSPNLQNRYLEVKSILDDPNLGYRQLELAKRKIDAFLLEEKNFLPIYIQEVRYTLISGLIGENDVLLHYKQAQNILDELIIRSPNYAKSYIFKGIIQTNLLQHNKAEKSFARAQILDANDPWLYNSLGMLKYRQQDNLSALTHYKIAFDLSNKDINSLTESFIKMVDLSNKLNQPLPNIDLIEIVFRNFNTKEDRLTIAKKLISNSVGLRDLQGYAYKVIKKQKELTSKCNVCDIEHANLILTSGFKYIKNNINYYYEDSMNKAVTILEQYKDSPDVNERVFNMLIDISFSKNDLEQVSQLILEAKSNNISENTLKLHEALIHFLNKDYKVVIEIFEQLIIEDKGLLDNEMYLTAKGRYGKITYKNNDGYEGLEQYYLRQIDRYPDNAYAYGNYVSFLLGSVKRDSAAAIIYGEKGMQFMQYGLLKRDLGLAYHIEASKLSFKSDNKADQIRLFKKSLSMGDIDYSKDSRCTTCIPYPFVKKIISSENIKKDVPFDYLIYIKLLFLILLICMIIMYLMSKKSIIKK